MRYGFIHEKVKVLVSQSCLTLCDPMDYNSPGSSLHGILQTRILKWVAIPFSSRSSQPRDRSWVSCFASRFFTIWATREAEDETVGWHHRLNKHEFGQTPGDGERQGSLAFCSPWGHKVGHDLMTEQQQCKKILSVDIKISHNDRS